MRVSNLVFSALVFILCSGAKTDIAFGKGESESRSKNAEVASSLTGLRSPLPTWSGFFKKTETERSQILENLKAILVASEGQELVSSVSRFCVSGGNVREVDLSTKCEPVRLLCAKQQAQCHSRWSNRECVDIPPRSFGARECYDRAPEFKQTQDLARAEWTLYQRVVSTFCSRNRSQAACLKLTERKVETPSAKTALLQWLVSFLVPTARAEELCVYNESSQGMEFPNGDTIYFDFASHGGAADGDCMDSLFGSTSLTKQEFSKALGECEKLNPFYLPSIQQRRDFVAKTVKNDKSVSWFGLELSEDQFSEEGLKQTYEALENFERSNRSLGVSQQESARATSLYYATGGAWEYAYRNKPARNKYAIVPLEDSAAKIPGLRALAESQYYQAQLQKALLAGKITKEQYLRLIKLGDRLLLDANSVSRSEIETAASDLPNELRSTAKNFLTKTSEMKDASQFREDAVVQNARSQRGSGVISFGGAHKESLLRKFATACEVEKKSNSPGSKSKSKASGSGKSAQ